MADNAGGGSRWVNTHNEDGAKLFMAEQERDNPVPQRSPRQRQILIAITALAIVAVALFLLLG